ncbi:CAMK family protein kinase [Tritrichomonas foetus]|uniref:Serine/threonine-protein kinase PLK n=1 Tax=Tritrichomonas foetus TaxID=1144522 RepID=A0A1J4K040_9EUKA|nr:CAMK family protein kinase [Tritrichomonas foetus]|eukprot:OHT04096.1 CAMK family protein kinase [Tritrichomonas foetus]
MRIQFLWTFRFEIFFSEKLLKFNKFGRKKKMLRVVTVPLTISRKREFGSTIIYKRHEELGRGGFAAVYRVTNQATGEEYALKAVPKERVEKPKSLEKLKCEIAIQRSLNHQNVLKSYDNFEDFQNYYILLEYAPNGSVKDMVKKAGHLSEYETARILREVMSGLCYLHDNRIIHRDLKLENFLIGKDGKVKIADFGLSTRLDFDDERKYTVCGTPNYLSPELLTNSSKGHSYEVDIWTIGVCAFAMLTGKPPFETPRRKLTYEHIKNCKYSFPPDIPLSAVARDFVKVILQIKPEKRPNAQDVALHPLLTQLPNKYKRINHIPLETKPTYETKKITPAIDSKKPLLDEKKDFKKPITDLKKPIIRTNDLARKNPSPTPINNNNFNNNNIKNSNNNGNNNIHINNAHNENGAGNGTPGGGLESPIQNGEPMVTMPKNCVSRFCDHSDKYGLGYMLIDGTIGACFNDWSRMVMDPFETFVQYWESYQTVTPEIMDPKTGAQTKKLALIRRFAESLKKTKSMYELPAKHFSSATPMKHVKYWMRNDDATLFRMDDRNIQVNFNDRTKLVIFWNNKKMMMVHSIKEAGKLVALTHVNSQQPNSEERKRYNVARSMLAAMSVR